ncbi:glycine-rich domain-containing protein [Catenovulum sp. SX2]|uniref:glycine-rich domain-containing protein n=1 Tax=Catenovulum sp. SX2 TaxID=3398614 RepID=UPI003F8406F1
MLKIIFITLSAVICLLAVYLLNQARLYKYRQRLIDTYTFPKKLSDEVANKYPHLDEQQIQSVIKGLREYFHICLDANKKFVAMPSQVVDVAWHEFILFTKEYNHFCKKAFGRFLHHTPAEAMEKPTLAQDGIKNTWKIACKRERINPKAPTALPTLFALDTLLKIEDGFKYSVNCSIKGSNQYCASHIGCGSGSGCGGSSDGGGSSCGGGCGGD